MSARAGDEPRDLGRGERRALRARRRRTPPARPLHPRHPHLHLDPDTHRAEVHALLERYHVVEEELPLVICAGARVLRNPGETDLARCLGLDLANPAGQGLRRRDRRRGTGRARDGGLRRVRRPVGDHARLPGVRRSGGSERSDRELPRLPDRHLGAGADGRAYIQAQKFGAEIVIPQEAARSICGRRTRASSSSSRRRDRERPRHRRLRAARATGASSRRTSQSSRAPRCSTGPRPSKRELCGGQDVALVGGGNSAGQAVVYPVRPRREGLGDRARRRASRRRMSRYLIDRIDATAEHRGPACRRRSPRSKDRGQHSPGSAGATARSATRCERPIRHLFLFIGAEPERPPGCPIAALSSTRRASCAPGELAAPTGGRSRPAVAGCSRSATCALAR